MLMLDADKLLDCMPFTTLVDELSAMHLEPIGLIDEMLMESTDDSDNVSHFFIRSGWQPEKAVGAKRRSQAHPGLPRQLPQPQAPPIRAWPAVFPAVSRPAWFCRCRVGRSGGSYVASYARVVRAKSCESRCSPSRDIVARLGNDTTREAVSAVEISG